MNLPAGNFTRTACYDPNTDLPNQYFSPVQFKAAWAHIRQIFAQEGATNAVWLWTVSGAGANALSYYPGPSQVDWVGFDNFDLTGTSLSATLGPTYSLLAPYGKPIMVTETGAGQSIQTPFFNSAATTLQTQFPLIKGFVYYDGIGIQDWRIVPAAIPAFATFANNPYMAARYVP
jgi:mannan endo-1,4-beta-mannosidase